MAASSTRVALSGGAYVARDVIADAQACVNLFGEKNAPDSPVPMTYYPTPGLALLATAAGPCRGLYTSGPGNIFAVFGATLCQIERQGFSETWGLVTLGTLTTSTGQPDPFISPVRMQDNGLVLMIVNGGTDGWYISLDGTGAPTGDVTLIVDPAWQGSTTVAILDTFFLFNVPGTSEFYLSPSNYIGNSTPLDPLYVAKTTAYPDNIAAIVTVAQLVWIIGVQVTEVWYDAGAADFPFARTPGVLLPYGTLSPYSVATINGMVFWLAHDAHGQNIVMMGQQYTADRVSTHALEYVWSGYLDTTGAIGTTYQEAGHSFYVLTFPSQDVTWCYDLASGEWHQRMSLDAAGAWHQWLGSFVSNSPVGLIVTGAGTAGVFQMTDTLGTDNGLPIQRVRSFPHLMSGGVRGIYFRFGIDLDTYGTSSGTFNLAYSMDRGLTFTASFPVTINSTDQEFPSIFRLGMARDRVFQVSWTDPNISALNGAYVWVKAANT